jgi:hypothetical protein
MLLRNFNLSWSPALNRLYHNIIFISASRKLPINCFSYLTFACSEMVWKRLKPDVNEVLNAIEELIAKEDRYQLGMSAR